MSEMVLPRFILCIIQYLRDGYIEPGENSLILSKLLAYGKTFLAFRFNTPEVINLFRIIWSNIVILIGS